MSSNWNAILPADASKIRLSAGLIRNNWVAIDTGTTGTGYGFSRNHVTLTDGTNGGLHYRVDYYQAQSSPTLTGISSLYARTVTNAELFYKNASADIQVTNSLLATSSGQGMLPGGLQIRCGTGSGITPVMFSPRFPVACLSVVLTIQNLPGATSAVSSVGPTGFTPVNGGGITFYWIAIGY